METESKPNAGLTETSNTAEKTSKTEFGRKEDLDGFINSHADLVLNGLDSFEAVRLGSFNGDTNLSDVLRKLARKYKFYGNLGKFTVTYLSPSSLPIFPGLRKHVEEDKISSFLIETEMQSTGRGTVGRFYTLVSLYVPPNILTSEKGYSSPPASLWHKYHDVGSPSVLFGYKTLRKGEAQGFADKLLQDARETSAVVEGLGIRHAYQGGLPSLGKRK